MIRSCIVSGLLAFFALPFLYVPAANADPVFPFAQRRVYGYLQTPEGGQTPGQFVSTTDTYGPFVAHIDEVVTELNASAAYTGDVDSSISEFLIESTGSASSSIATTNQGDTYAYADSYTYVQFLLDGSYDYDFSGGLLASGGVQATAELYSFSDGGIWSETASGSAVPLAHSGTLDAGLYYLYLYAVAGSANVGAHSASYNATLSLTPTSAVPDAVNTAILFVLGSAFLAAFTPRHRRQTQ
jgi:hypothetical protein